jgi:hypothetical protein
MVETPSKTQILLARLTIILLIAFTAFGIIWYGFSEEVRAGLENLNRAISGVSA